MPAVQRGASFCHEQQPLPWSAATPLGAIGGGTASFLPLNLLSTPYVQVTFRDALNRVERSEKVTTGAALRTLHYCLGACGSTLDWLPLSNNFPASLVQGQGIMQPAGHWPAPHPTPPRTLFLQSWRPKSWDSSCSTTSRPTLTGKQAWVASALHGRLTPRRLQPVHSLSCVS